LFLFTVTSTTEIYTLSLHDALPIWPQFAQGVICWRLVSVALRTTLRNSGVHVAANCQHLGLRSQTLALRRKCLGHLPIPLDGDRSEEHTSELQSPYDLVCRLLLEKK